MRVDKLLTQPLLQTSSSHAHGTAISRHHIAITACSTQYNGSRLHPSKRQRLSHRLAEVSNVDHTAPPYHHWHKEHLLEFSAPPPRSEASGGPSSSNGGISDPEYQTRVGKACRVLVDSLPDFMNKGVVDLQDLDEAHESSSSTSILASPSRWSAKNILPSLSPFLGQSLLRRSSWTRKGKEKASGNEAADAEQLFDSLYHPSIAFEFRPPLPHIGIGKSEEPDANSNRSRTASSAAAGESNHTSLELYDEHHRGGPTICFNGRTMYVASSHLLRHALSALFHDTSLHLESARFEGRSKAGSSWPGISPYIRRHTPDASNADSNSSSNGSWQDKLIIRLRFEGISRVTSHPHTYTVIFKYEFDRRTGMIVRHVVDNIQPVPGSKVWAGLSHAWGNLTPAGAVGGGGGGAATGGGSAACSSRADPKTF